MVEIDNILNLMPGRNDFVQVSHDKTDYLLQVKEIWTKGDKTQAKLTVVGTMPRTPFKPFAPCYMATERLVRNTLGIFTPEEVGLYLGRLRGHPYKAILPLKKLTRCFICGKSGSGKSYTVGVVIEEFLRKGVPTIIFDRHGEYSSLKVKADTIPLHAEFNVEPKSFQEQIIEFADLEVNPGADIPFELLLTSAPKDLIISNQCTIVNLRGMELDVQEKLAADILRDLYNASVKGEIQPFYCVLDEAHLFAPKKKSEVGEIVKLFAQEGRKFGANLIVVTQKPQLLDTTVRSQAGTWLIHQLTDVRDIDITIKSSEGLSTDWTDDISRLDPGEAVITGDVLKDAPIILKVRPRLTVHGGSGFNVLDFITDEEKETLEERRKRLYNIAQLGEAQQEFQALFQPEGSKSDDIKELKNRIAELEKDLKKAKKDKEKAIKVAEIAVSTAKHG